MLDYGKAIVAALLTFIAPCVLPLMPIYISYFTAGEKGKAKTLIKVLAFCAGITLFFIVLFTTAILAGQALASTVATYPVYFNVTCGVIIMLMGLKIMGYLNLPFLDKSISFTAKTDDVNIVNAFVMGLVFSLSLGTCALGYIWAAMSPIFLGAGVIKSITISVLYIVVLNALFIICALLIDQLKGLFGFIKRHYKIINLISGILLVVLGLAIAYGLMDKLTALFQ